MKNKKKVKTAVIVAAAVTGVAGAGVAGVTYIRKNNSKAVEVTPVATLNMGDMLSMGSDDGTSGQVVSNVSQNVRIPDGKVIDQVYVKEGDKVKIGDKLLSYDTTLLGLDKELQEITVMELGLEIKSAEADLAKLQNAKPGDAILDNLSSDSSSSLTDSADDVESDEGDDGGDEEARLVDHTRELLAAQEDGIGESAASDTQTESTEQAATENSGDMTETQESSSVSESEAVIDQSDSNADNSGEVLTPGDLDGSENGTDQSNDQQQDSDSDKNEKAKHNQSLEKFFTNIRVKLADDGEEPLLADVKQGEQAEFSLDGKIKLIPHFAEDTEHHFRSKDTYTMLIRGVKLKKQIEGKVYGTAQINGEDYPEIGGFTLAQKSDSEDVVQLTIAFHDGLDQQHEILPELEDMYLELTLDSEEVSGDQLTVRTAGEEKDIIFTVKGAQSESESETESETETDSEMTEAPETEQAGDVAVLDQDGEDSVEPGTEQPDEDLITQPAFEVQNIHFQIHWNHGTNSVQSRPASMKAYFYQKGVMQQEDPDCTFTLTPGSSAAAGVDNGVDGTGETVAEEVTTETTAQTEAQTEASSENAETGTGTEAFTESMTEEETAPAEEITDETDTTSAIEDWKTIDLKLPDTIKLNSSELGESEQTWNELWSGYAPNYSMKVTGLKLDASDASATVQITMTYNQPEESPLLKLNPISELTWQHGVNTLNETGMRAYKGSGTAEEPYVFFVTDGVKITNTFVNWVLGFNEEGTERVSDGYYVRLEIRESDTITGAFIRSIDLDGTVLTDHGYGPGTYWVFNSDTGITKYEEEVPDDGGGGMDPGWGNDNDGSTYTAEELAQAIEDKKLEIQKLKLDERQAKLKLKNYNKQMEESTVVSAVDGYVKSINGSGEDAYMVVDSENGLYVKTTVSELDLADVAVDQVVNCSSWDTGAQFTAKITEIDAFPSSEDGSDNYYGSSGNVNSSSYPVLAVVDEDTAENLSEYESVSVTFPSTTVTDTGAIYLEKAYIRAENGQSYVYIADENEKLKKQYIRTGGTVWGYVEVKQGLSTDDQIAFPYGKTVKEGAAVKLADEE